MMRKAGKIKTVSEPLLKIFTKKQKNKTVRRLQISPVEGQVMCRVAKFTPVPNVSSQCFTPFWIYNRVIDTTAV